jgi:hypothetical protein
MVASIERIERDIAALEAAIAALAQEFHDTYTGYLEALGRSVRQQLTLAAYHICTQSYPDQFLALSYNQRQQLQQSIRDLAQQIQKNLPLRLKPVASTATTLATAPAEVTEEPDLLPSEEQSSALSNTDLLAEVLNAGLAKRMSPPEHLLRWHESLERGIHEELRVTSHAVNRLLQQAAILPQKLPEPVLEAAVRAEAADAMGSTPNLLNLMIEAVSENDTDKADKKESAEPQRPEPQRLSEELEKLEKLGTREGRQRLVEELEKLEKLGMREGRLAAIMHVTTIHLRLSEVEFSDSTLTAWRTRIRNLLSRLQALGRDYEKKQKERTIAEAEAAWRLSWSDD